MLNVKCQMFSLRSVGGPEVIMSHSVVTAATLLLGIIIIITQIIISALSGKYWLSTVKAHRREIFPYVKTQNQKNSALDRMMAILHCLEYVYVCMCKHYHLPSSALIIIIIISCSRVSFSGAAVTSKTSPNGRVKYSNENAFNFESIFLKVYFLKVYFHVYF